MSERTLEPLNIIDGRLFCPRCGERQTSIVEERGDTTKWECDLCGIGFFASSGLKPAALAAQPDPRVKGLVEACEGLVEYIEFVYDPLFDVGAEKLRLVREALAAAKGEPASERPWTRSEERMPPASWLKSDVWEVRGGNLEGVKIMMSVYGQNEQPLWANLDGYVCVIAGTEWRPVEG